MLTPEQLAQRKNGIGASEVSTLFNLNDYMTPYKLWAIKTGMIEPADLSDNDAVWWGNNLEEVIARRYSHETGNTLENLNITKVCPESPYLFATPDRFVAGKNKLLEIKTASYNPDKWGQPGSSEVPMAYQLQCAAQMACCPGYDSVDLAVFIWQTRGIQIYTIQRNEEMISSIVNTVNRFWNNHVLANVPPELFNADDVKLCYPTDNSQFLEASPIEVDSYTKLNDIRKQMKSLAVDELKYKNDLIVLIGAHSGITHNGDILCTYKADKRGSRRFNFNGE